MDVEHIVVDQYQWILLQAKRYCSNRMDAEDLAEETVYKILSNKQSYDSEKPFRPWCKAILQNTFLTRCKRNCFFDYTDPEVLTMCRSDINATDLVLVHEVKDVVCHCRHMSCSVDCLVLYAMGYTYSEISERYSIPSGTVKSRISYARELIRKHLDIQKVK